MASRSFAEGDEMELFEKRQKPGVNLPTRHGLARIFWNFIGNLSVGPKSEKRPPPGPLP
jgi:hypothetical protein